MDIVQFVAEAAAVGVWSVAGYIFVSKTPKDEAGWRTKRFVARYFGVATALSWLAWGAP